MARVQATPKGPSFVTVADRSFLPPRVSHEGLSDLSHVFPSIGPGPWRNQRRQTCPGKGSVIHHACLSAWHPARRPPPRGCSGTPRWTCRTKGRRLPAWAPWLRRGGEEEGGRLRGAGQPPLTGPRCEEGGSWGLEAWKGGRGAADRARRPGEGARVPGRLLSENLVPAHQPGKLVWEAILRTGRPLSLSLTRLGEGRVTDTMRGGGGSGGHANVP